MKVLYRLMTQMSSRKSISKLAGFAAKSRLSKHLIPHFIRTYRIDAEEAEFDVSEYKTLNSFFTRKMKAHLRPINQEWLAVVSPVDGRVTSVGKVQNGTILNIKQQNYTLSELLGNEEQSDSFNQGAYIILYLSPRDYHRIHSPLSGTIEKHEVFSGTVYPVNPFGLTYGKRVLSRNERVITYIQHPQARMALVSVGAMNVASIKIKANQRGNRVDKGDEVAYFEFGSTVIVLFENDKVQLDQSIQEGQSLKMGEGIGYLMEDNQLEDKR